MCRRTPSKLSSIYTPPTAGLPLPPDGDGAAFEAALRALPPAADADPRAFGLHPSAALALNAREGRRLLDAVLSLQPRRLAVSTAAAPAATATDKAAAAVGGGGAAEGALLARVDEIAQGLPKQLSASAASVLRDPFGALPGGGVDSLGTVLRQEIARWGHCSCIALGSSV